MHYRNVNRGSIALYATPDTPDDTPIVDDLFPELNLGQFSGDRIARALNLAYANGYAAAQRTERALEATLDARTPTAAPSDTPAPAQPTSGQPSALRKVPRPINPITMEHDDG